MSVPSAKSIVESVKQIAHAKQEADLLQYLIEIQHQYSCIPPVALQTLHQLLNIPTLQIESVISFYSFLSIEYQGRFRILFSDNITDRMAGSQKLFQQLEQAVKGEPVTMGYTSCTGLCDQGPGMLINGQAINRLDSKRINEIARLIKKNRPLKDWPDYLFDIENNIRHRDLQLNIHAGNGDSLHRVLEQGAQKALNCLDKSGLRGRGGAGFKTASKWDYCRQADSKKRYVVCNADEGEPGTFKDRVLLNSSAHSVIEGMTICASVIGAEYGFIYLRGEYRYLLKHLNEVLQQRRSDALLGKDILGHAGFNFDIKIHLGAGAYICGEESALIESLEGKRGIPRIRPPFPVVEGYKSYPTVVNNVETFWSVNRILLKGSSWFRQAGTDESSGTRLLSISGDCEKPGIYEYPFGISMKQILKDCGGYNAQAIQMAGAAGNLVLAKDFDRCMSFEDLSTGGSFMVIGPQRSLIDVLDNFAEFFRHESCGFCTPCRVGTTLIADLIQRFKKGQGSQIDLNQLRTVSEIMQHSSFCGLGCSAPTAFIDAMNETPDLFNKLMQADAENPAFDLNVAVSEFSQLTAS